MNYYLSIPFLFFFLNASAQNADRICTRADSLFGQGEYKSCVPYYQEASSLYKNSNPAKSIYCENKIADSYTREGRLDESLVIAEKALSMCPAQFVEQKGEINNTLGMIYLEKGRHDVAEDYFKKALASFSLENKKTESKASCYNNLGLSYWISGNNELALEHMNQALHIRKEIFGEQHITVAASYNNIGLILSSEKPAEAILYYNLALEIYKKIYKENHPNIAIGYNNIGIIERKQGQTQESLKSFEKALHIWLKIFNPDHPNVAFVYSNMAQAYLDGEQYTFALENYEKALSIYKKNHGEKHPEIATTYNSIGTILESQKKYDAALESFQLAICANTPDFNDKSLYVNPSLTNYYNGDVLLVSLLLKARTLESRHYAKTLKVNDLKYSLKTFEVCDSLLDKIRQIRTSKNDKIELGRIGSEVYEDAISVAISLSELTLKKNHYLRKAFYFAEKNKSAVLMEAIADAKAKNFAGIPDSLLEKEKSLKDDITFYEQKLAEGPIAEKEKAYREKLFQLHRKYEDLIDYLETKFPNYYNLKYNVKALTVGELQNSLDQQTALINYFLAESRNRIYLFYITKNKFRVYNYPKEPGFTKDLAKFVNAIKMSAEETYVHLGSALYSKLIPKGIPSKITKLIIIPEGRLGNIPYEALLTKKSKKGSFADLSSLPYLIKRFAISYDYSCSLFAESVTNSREQKNSNNSALLYAPVHFAPEENLKSLEGSAAEVEKISAIFKSHNYTAHTALLEKANEENLKSDDLKNYNYLHFATHGIVDEDKPELSQIYLSKSKESWEDGNLYSGEIYNLEIKADLVVLSACETGLGKIKKGEGVIGLSRALLYAGANNLVVSLWSVSDEATSHLMIDFYSMHLGDNTRDYSAALQKAKLKMIAEGKFSHPYFWAPFIFIGK